MGLHRLILVRNRAKGEVKAGDESVGIKCTSNRNLKGWLIGESNQFLGRTT
jgi:hypothetical protein